MEDKHSTTNIDINEQSRLQLLVFQNQWRPDRPTTHCLSWWCVNVTNFFVAAAPTEAAGDRLPSGKE